MYLNTSLREATIYGIVYLFLLGGHKDGIHEQTAPWKGNTKNHNLEKTWQVLQHNIIFQI